MSSVLVEQGLLGRFARTILPIVADFTRSFARLLMGISDSAKRLLVPSEDVDEIAIEDRDMEEIKIKDRLFCIYSVGRRELLQTVTVVNFTRFHANLMKMTADAAQYLHRMMDDPHVKIGLQVGEVLCSVG
jgi:hypothetical protein